MEKKAIAYWSLLLRTLTLVYLLLPYVLLLNHNITFNHDCKPTFKDIIGFRYVFIIKWIAAAYTILQLGYAIYYVCKGKRLYPWLQHLDFYGDKLICLLLATAVGFGFGLISFGVLLVVGTACMAVLSVLSSIDQTHPAKDAYTELQKTPI